MIGGGASGMMAALTAAENGAAVMLLEKNDRLGKKMLITGKGRCNVTTNKEIGEIINSFVHNGKFLYTALNSFSNQQVQQFFEDAGVPLRWSGASGCFRCRTKLRILSTLCAASCSRPVWICG